MLIKDSVIGLGLNKRLESIENCDGSYSSGRNELSTPSPANVSVLEKLCEETSFKRYCALGAQI